MRTGVLITVLAASMLALVLGGPSAPESSPRAAALAGPAISLVPADPLVRLGGNIPATVTLSVPAPAGGLTVSLSSLNPLVATMTPGSVVIPAGATTSAPGAITVNGLTLGTTTLLATAPGYANGSASIGVTNVVISLGLNVAVIPGQTAGFPVSLSIPAPPGGVTINFLSSDPLVLLTQPNVFIPAGQQIPAANPQITGVALGQADIFATAVGFAPDTRQVDVAANVFSFSPANLNVAEGLTGTIDVEIAVAAPPGGQTVMLATDHPGIASVPVSVLIAAGETSAEITVTGVSAGTTTLRANATGIPEATAQLTVIPPAITIPDDDIGDDLQVARNGSLTAPAPAGNLVVTLTSSDPSRLLLANDSTSPGQPSITVMVGAGQTSLPTWYVHALDDSGFADVVATAPGYAAGTATYDFHPSGFIIWSPSAINVTTGAADTSVSVRPVRLNPATLAYVESQRVRGGIAVNVGIQSSAPAVGFMTVDPIMFSGGDLSLISAFDALTIGAAVIDLATPAGFQTPSSFQSITATVSGIGIDISGTTIGDDLQAGRGGSLSAPAPAGNLIVTLTSTDPARLLLAPDSVTAGAASINVQVNAGSSSLPTWYAHALDDTGTADVVATAPGYAPGTATFDLVPSGFIVWSPSVINTTTGVAASSLSLRPVRLNPATLAYAASQQLRGGFTASVPVTSSDPVVGTITVDPVVFNGGDLSRTTGFLPGLPGVSQLSLTTPPGFDTPSSFTSIAANVFGQSITVSGTAIGDDLQVGRGGSLSAPAPAGNLMVTLTSTDPARLLLAPDSTSVGMPSITVQVNAGSASLPTWYAHALDDNGSVDVVASAPGYGSGTATFDLRPSGFIIWSPSSINTSTFSPPSAFSLRPVRLDAATLAYQASQNLRGGLSVGVTITSSDTNVGTITVPIVTFSGGDLSQSSGFTPLIAGSSNIDVVTPFGFDTPASFTQITASVSAPAINISDVNVGEDLQLARSISLASAPPNPVDVTVTVNDPTIATISTDPLVAGGATVTFFGVTSTSVGTIQVQGRLIGGTSITVQAAGYSDGTSTVDVDPSGFIIWSPSSITTTIYSPPSTVSVRPVRLDPITLNYAASQRMRGGMAAMVPVMTLDPAVGTMTVDPIPFGPNDLSANTAFQPGNVGVTQIAIASPPPFDMSSNFTQMTATVGLPTISMSGVVVGEDLQVARSISLQAAPPGPTQFRVEVADSSVATISTSTLVAGGQQLIFNGITGSSLPTIYVHGRRVGTTTISVGGPNYQGLQANVTVDPSGFIIWSPSSINTSTFSGASGISVRPVRLNPVTLNYAASQRLRGSLGVIVDLSVANPAIGWLTLPQVKFNAGDLAKNSGFQPAGGGSTTISMVTPAGFDTSSNFVQIAANVSAPTISFSNSVVGVDLQQSRSVTLQAAPPAPVPVTLTVANPAIATITTNASMAGGGGLVLGPTMSTNAGTVQVQGRAVGTTTITVTAPGYMPRIANVTVDPSGFVIWSPSSITTTAASGPTTVQLRPVRLNPTTLNYAASQPLRGGASVAVGLASSNPAAGTITTSPLVFNGTDLAQNSGFQPVAAGSSTVTVLTPAGWSAPSNLFQISATVNP